MPASLTMTGDLADLWLRLARAHHQSPEDYLKTILEQDGRSPQEALIRAATEGRPDVFFILLSRRDEQGEIVDFDFAYVNHAAEQQLGKTRDELLGHGICEMFPINRTDGYFERYKRVVKTRDPYEADYYIPPEAPATGWWHQYVSPLEGLDGISISNVNIDARKQIEQDLRQAHHRFETLGENLPHGAIYQLVIHPDGQRHFEYVSRSVEQVVGIRAEEILADAQALYDLTPLEDLATLLQAEKRALEHLEPCTCEFRVQNSKTGELIWLNARSMPRRLPTGETVFDGIMVDISAQKYLQDILKRNKRMLHETEMIAQVGGFTQDLQSGEIIWTEGAYQINEVVMGTPITAELVTALYSPEDQARLALVTANIIENKGTADLDLLATTPRGTQKWLNIHAHPILEENEVVGIQGIVQDITTRKHHEEILRQSLDLLDTLGNNLPAGAIYQVVYTTTGRNYFQYMSSSIEALLGIRAEDIIRDPQILYQTLVPEDVEPVLQELRLLSQEGGAFNYQVRHLTTQGEIKWVQYRAAPRQMPNGDRVYDGIMTDITRQKQLEQDLRRSETVLKKTQQLARLGGWEMDFRTDQITWTEEAYAIYEVPLGTPISRDYLDSLSTPFYRSQMRHARRMARERQTTNVETQIITPTGKQKWIRMVSDPIIENGEVIGANGMVQDITLQKLAQDREIQLQVEQERVQILADFVQNIGHEFRTPLTIIQSSLDLLLLRPEIAANREKHAARIRVEIQNILTLVEDLTTLVSLDSSTKTYLEPIDMAEFLARLKHLVSEATNGRYETAFHMDVSAESFLGNDHILLSAFGQIINNAVQHTPMGGNIWFYVVQINRELEFHICDSGVGMSPEVLDHAFERFYRGNKAHTTRGFGLGLAIAQKVVELHNGQIRLESTENKGTNVIIRLPLG